MSFDDFDNLKPIIERIDITQQQANMLKEKLPDAYSRIIENWAVESTYNSNNIEGSTLSLGDNALLYEGVTVDAPAIDISQAEGGFAALKFLNKVLNYNTAFSEDIVKRAHEIIYAEAESIDTRGVYRHVEVEIIGTDFQPTPSIYVSERMSALVQSC